MAGSTDPRHPRWWEIGGKSKWMSAASFGSGMNSLQISDLAGTNVHMPNGNVTTSLYITTQDNALYTSPDGGATWKTGDGREGFGVEGRPDANNGESAQLVYVGIGGVQDTFADLNVTNKRPVPALDENGAPLTGFQNPYFVDQQPGTNTSNWVRRRLPNSMPVTEVYSSNNSGENWRKFATVNFKFAGEVRTVGQVAWLPVFLGGIANEIALVPLATATPPDVPPPTYDDSDVVRLPGKGSLGQRFTEFDKHAVYGVHPTNWAYVIAPDIVANDMKVTRNGGKNWHTSAGLTAQVLRGGALKMWGGKADLIQVTEISFDPYNAGRILVGTRDAGIICTDRRWQNMAHDLRLGQDPVHHWFSLPPERHGLHLELRPWTLAPEAQLGLPENVSIPLGQREEFRRRPVGSRCARTPGTAEAAGHSGGRPAEAVCRAAAAGAEL